MIVVSDASILINLAWIGQLDLLPKLYQKVLIPTAVWREVAVKGSGKQGASAIQQATWLQVEKAQNEMLIKALLQTLDQGEAEAIVLAMEKQADLLLMDERLGRATASQFNLAITGLIGVLLVGQKQGHITSLRPLLNQLRHEAGFYISARLYDYALELAGEI